MDTPGTSRGTTTPQARLVSGSAPSPALWSLPGFHAARTAASCPPALLIIADDADRSYLGSVKVVSRDPRSPAGVTADGKRVYIEDSTEVPAELLDAMGIELATPERSEEIKQAVERFAGRPG